MMRLLETEFFEFLSLTIAFLVYLNFQMAISENGQMRGSLMSESWFFPLGFNYTVFLFFSFLD